MAAETALRIAIEKIAFLPATRVTDDVSVLTLKNLVFEPLVRWRDGRVGPGLFGRWEHHEGGRRWRFDIREGARFHDGKPCTADDVLAFIDGILQSVDMFGMKWSYARYLAQARLSALSAQTVEVVNPRPFADVLDVFSEFYVCRADDKGLPILGTGPYCVDHLSGHTAVLVRGPARLTFIAIPEAEARYDALRAGAVDVAMNLERAHARIDRDGRFAWHQAANTLSVMYYLNCRDGLFADAVARRAVNLAVDRPRLIDQLMHGLAVPASTIVSPFHLGFAAGGTTPFDHDPDAARRLLANCSADKRITIRTPSTLPEKAREISEAVAEQLQVVGIDARIALQTDRPEYAREVGRKQIGDMAIFDSSPHSTYRVLDDKISARTRGVWWQGYDDPEVETLIDAANAAVDDDAREHAYGRCLARLRDNPPWLYLFHPIVVCAAAGGSHGIGLDHKGILTVAS